MCQKVSPGCTHCYAETIVGRFWSLDADVKFPGYTAQGITSGKFVLDNKQILSILKIKKPAKVFWGDMCDLFHEDIPDRMLDMCLATCALTPHLMHMFLTKRPERMQRYFAAMDSRGGFAHVLTMCVGLHFPLGTEATMLPIPTPLPNVMLGTSAENQKYFDERIEYLQKLKDQKWKTFLSLEPLIGPIDVEYPKSMYPHGAPMCCNGEDCGCRGMPVDPPMIYGVDLAIVGGESGHGARPMQTHWASNIQQACHRWNVSFFFKQQGMWIDAGHEEFGKLPSGQIAHYDSYGNRLTDDEVRTSSEESDVCTMKRVTRERAGKTLYGKAYHEFPTYDFPI